MASPKIVQYYGTGRRKTATARVFLRPGSGKMRINGRDVDHFFTRETLRMIVRQPLRLIGQAEGFDVVASIAGGGTAGQAEALRHGLARALVASNPGWRGDLKRAGFLT